MIKNNGGIFGRNPTFNNVEVEGDLTVDGNYVVSGDIAVTGNATVAGAVDVAGAITTTNTTASTSSTTGALIVSGGAGFAKDININGVAAGVGVGTSNTKFGNNAHSQMLASGGFNTAVGFQAGFWNSTGSGNTALGSNCLLNTRTGSWNSAFGINSLYTNQSGSHNVANGLESLYSLTSATGQNVGIGSNAAYNFTNVANAIAIGYNAAKFQSDGLTALTGGSSSVYIGSQCRGLNNSDSNSIVIGASAVGLGANTTVIGTSSTTNTKVFGTLTLDATSCISASSATALAIKSIVPAGTGVTPTIQIICPYAAFALQNSNTAQNVFSIPNDVITTVANTTYMVDGLYILQTGTIAHTTSINFVSAVAIILPSFTFTSLSSPIAINAAANRTQDTGTYTTINGGVVSSSSAVANTTIRFTGILRTTDAGSITPQLTFGTAPGSTNFTLAGSFLRFYPIGADSINSVGTAIG